MENLYPTIKNIHLLIVGLSIILFNVRVGLLAAQPNKKLPLPLKIAPHINDTMLLFSGMMMMTIAKWQPFGAHQWLGAKLLLLVGYVVCGVLCLRSRPRSSKFWLMYVLSMVVVGIMAYVARFKPF